MKLKALRARLAQIHKDHTAALAVLEKEGATEAERTQAEADVERLDAEFYATDAQIKRLEKAEKLNKSFTAGNGRQTEPEADRDDIVVGDDLSTRDPLMGFKSGAEFFEVVRAASLPGSRADERLAKINASLPGTVDQEGGSTDGYMVPPQIRQDVVDAVSDDGSEIYNMITAEPTDSNQVQMFADETTPWGSTGVQAYWASEKAQFQPSKLETKLKDVKLHKLYAFVLATDELLDDAPRTYNRLTRQSGRAIAWKSSDAIMNGSGVGMPLGFMKAPALVTVNKESGQAAATINATNLAKMLSRHLNIPGSIWLANTDLIPQLITMVLGTGSSARPIFIPDSGTLADTPRYGTILGRPVVFSEHASALGSLGDISLIDPEGYYLTEKSQGIQFAQSMHLYFDYDVMAFRWTFRLGGQPFLSKAIDRAHGTNTKSHFVTLQAR